MNVPSPRVYVISGVPGAGKTSTARALALRFEKAIVVTGDDIRDMVVSGFVSGLDPWSEEHDRQFRLSWRAEASLAASYSDAGFTVVMDDVMSERDYGRYIAPALGARSVHKVFLRPDRDIAVARNRARTNKTFDVERLVPVIDRLCESLPSDVEGWIVIDTTALTVDETVAEIEASTARG